MRDTATIIIDCTEGSVTLRVNPVSVEEFGLHQKRTSKAQLIAQVLIKDVGKLMGMNMEQLRAAVLADLKASAPKPVIKRPVPQEIYAHAAHAIARSFGKARIVGTADVKCPHCDHECLLHVDAPVISGVATQAMNCPICGNAMSMSVRASL